MTLQEFIITNVLDKLPGDDLYAKCTAINDDAIILDPYIWPICHELIDKYRDDVFDLAADNEWLSVDGKYDCDGGLAIYDQILSDDFNRDHYYYDMTLWTIEQIAEDILEAQ